MVSAFPLTMAGTGQVLTIFRDVEGAASGGGPLPGGKGPQVWDAVVSVKGTPGTKRGGS
jgi:hypothetical protein